MNDLSLQLARLTVSGLNTIQPVREWPPVDNAVVLFLNVMEAISTRVYGPCFDPQRLKTYKQLAREEELRKMKQMVDPDSACHTFCRVTAIFVDELAKQVFAENLALLPAKVEDWAHFKMCLGLPYYTGYLLEYAYIQMQRRRDVRGELIDSERGKTLQRFYGRLRAKVADSLLDKAVVEVFVSFEHALWKVCLKAKEMEARPQGEKVIPPLLCSVLKALAPLLQSQIATIETLKAQAKIDALSREEALICCIVDCKRKKLLPPNLPDPDKVRLDVANLHQELDSALHSYLSRVVEQLLDKHVSLGGLSKVLYALEGRHFLKETATSFLVQFVMEQFLDPDQFAVLLLSGARVETMPLEKQGFGPGSPEVVWEFGQKFFAHVLAPDFKPETINEAFKKTNLRYNPKCRKEIHGRLETRKQLTQLISGMIRKLFDKKPKDRTASNGLTTESLRKAVGELPYVGPITKGLRLAFNTTYLSIQYFLSEAEKEDSFAVWLTKELSGDPLFNHLAEKVVELIYHPAWRIFLLQALHTIIEEEVFEKKTESTEREVQQNFETCARFFFSHLAPPSMQQTVGKWATYFTGEQAFQKFKAAATERPQESMLEKRLPLIQSVVEEYLLYVRLTQIMRKLGIEVEGDSKFWEFYIRCYLNKYVALHPDNESAREDCVRFLISCEPNTLIVALSQPPQ